MSSILTKYKVAVANSYGWNIDLTCPRCRFSGKPRYEGSSQNLKANLHENASIYAKLACPGCGHRLTDQAAGKIVELFKNLPIPDGNNRIISRFIAALIGIPLSLAFLLFFGMQMDWWTWGYAIWLLIASASLIPFLAATKNYRVAQLRSLCECGRPDYLFVASLNGFDCYRCSSCGRLMKLRD